jgi:hypothetical protein
MMHLTWVVVVDGTGGRIQALPGDENATADES